MNCRPRRIASSSSVLCWCQRGRIVDEGERAAVGQRRLRQRRRFYWSSAQETRSFNVRSGSFWIDHCSAQRPGSILSGTLHMNWIWISQPPDIYLFSIILNNASITFSRSSNSFWIFSISDVWRFQWFHLFSFICGNNCCKSVGHVHVFEYQI